MRRLAIVAVSGAVVFAACGGSGHSAAPTTTSTTAPAATTTTTPAPSIADVCAKAKQALASTDLTLGNAAVSEASALNAAGMLPTDLQPAFPFYLLNNPTTVSGWLEQAALACPALGH